jgi:hypothetical protein
MLIMDSIIREPTKDELRDFTPIISPSRAGKKSTEQKFLEELSQKVQAALKTGKPFAERVARDDFYDHYNQQAKLSLRKNGYVDPDDIKPVKMDWAKYSDLKNFDVEEEGEINDEFLTKRNPGLSVNVKFTKYKFKGYSNIYMVMEDGPSAIRRAKDAIKALEK